jgi:hypothetical protein
LRIGGWRFPDTSLTTHATAALLKIKRPLAHDGGVVAAAKSLACLRVDTACDDMHMSMAGVGMRGKNGARLPHAKGAEKGAGRRFHRCSGLFNSLYFEGLPPIPKGANV